ncbi:hypothetical protein ACI0FM_13655 [Paenochrobactrum sp. BZR 588]|uniref:hypothetical protein n=1 Tax=unclassified Paenochrobactrum TaxID=2639760 RepID=UPI0038549F15
MFRNFSICTLLMLSSIAGHAVAQDIVPADDYRLDKAWEALISEEGSFLSQQQMATLNSLAFQAAGVRLCDDHKLDHKTFAEQISAIIAASDKDLVEEQVEQRKASIMIAFGARYGIFLAEGSLHADPFCRAIAEVGKAENGAPVVMK